MDKISSNKPSRGNARVQTLLAKDVSRQEFLKIIGLGGLTLVGLGPLIGFLTGKSTGITKIVGQEYDQSRSKYNAGRYGV